MDNQDKNETYQEFEARFNKKQEGKTQKRLAELEGEFPLQERLLRFEQERAKKKAEQGLKELNEFDGGEEPVDTSGFKPITAAEIVDVLGQTIKKDETNKLLTFFTEISAYTENCQLNISFNAPSSSGKSFIPTEIASLFPEKDVIEVGYCSPTAFFHSIGAFDKEKQGYTVDLSRKILIFLDQPHTQLLQHLRPLLSHDKKEILIKITDKSQKVGLRTKNIYLKGFPAVIFCTAGLNLDEQEATRFLLLSPEINQEKIRQAIFEKIKKEADSFSYKNELNSDPKRQRFIQRILAIKQEKIAEIKLSNPELFKTLLLERIKTFKPRHQRDVNRIISLTKIFALLNLWFRERNGVVITANEEDIREAFRIWDLVSESQELNLPPYVLNIFKEVIIPKFLEKNQGVQNIGEGLVGLTRKDIADKHYQVYGRIMADWMLRQQILPLLETVGLITQESDPDDKRKILIYPTTSLTVSPGQNNSESDGGVEAKTIDQLTEDEQLEACKEIFGEGTKWAEENGQHA